MRLGCPSMIMRQAWTQHLLLFLFIVRRDGAKAPIGRSIPVFALRPRRCAPRMHCQTRSSCSEVVKLHCRMHEAWQRPLLQPGTRRNLIMQLAVAVLANHNIRRISTQHEVGQRVLKLLRGAVRLQEFIQGLCLLLRQPVATQCYWSMRLMRQKEEQRAPC